MFALLLLSPPGWMTILEHLCLSENGLSGTLPPDLAMMRTLRTLKLDFNDLSGG